MLPLYTGLQIPFRPALDVGEGQTITQFSVSIGPSKRLALFFCPAITPH